MIQLENPIQIIAGGYYKGDYNWNNSYSHSDDCYKLYNTTHGENVIGDAAYSGDTNL